LSTREAGRPEGLFALAAGSSGHPYNSTNMKKIHYSLIAALSLFLGPTVPGFAQRAPSIDEAKQALNRRWQQLKPSSVTERNVLFEDIRAGRPDGPYFPFKATVIIRDYDPGYPPNHYYGKTCVSRMEGKVFTLQMDPSFGEWHAEGRMAPDMNETRCQNNPAANVSSIPLASLSGTPAPSGQIAPPRASATPPAAAAAGRMPAGAYECWANGQANLILNFTVTGGNRYTGSDGQSGTFSLDGQNRITFHGGSLDGAMPNGFYAVYHAPQGRPTVSFRNPQGSEAAYCERR
jgi:hypothetical protein